MNIRYLFFLFIAVLAGFTSCKNNDEVFAPKVSTYINVINASADTLNYFINGTRKNNFSGLYPGSQSYYLPVPAGAQNYSFKKTGSPVVLLNLPLNFQNNVNYSLYVTGGTTIQSFNTLDFLDTTGIGTKFSKIRFVNATPDADPLNITVGDSIDFFNAASYKSSSQFFLTGPSGKKHIQIFVPGSTGAKVDTTLVIQLGHIYTIFSRGLLNGRGAAALNVGLALNYQ